MDASLTETTLTIRCLTPFEIHLCVPHAQAFHAEMQLSGTVLPDLFIKNWTYFMAQFHGDILALWKGEELLGGLGTILVPDIYDGRMTATEMFWYIAPEHRHGTGAVRLLKAFEAWSMQNKAAECRLVHMLGAEETPRESQLGRIYTKLGYKLIEASWLKPLTYPVEV